MNPRVQARSSAPRASDSAETVPRSPSVFFRYQSKDGRVVIVDSLDHVPTSERSHVERIELERPEASRFPVVSGLVEHMDWPSFAAGFGVALFVAVIAAVLSRGSSRVMGALVLLALVVGGGGAYFGWLHRVSGNGDATFASPATLMDDARRAVEQVKQRDKDQERVIKDIERQSK